MYLRFPNELLFGFVFFFWVLWESFALRLDLVSFHMCALIWRGWALLLTRLPALPLGSLLTKMAQCSGLFTHVRRLANLERKLNSNYRQTRSTDVQRAQQQKCRGDGDWDAEGTKGPRELEDEGRSMRCTDRSARSIFLQSKKKK